MLSRLSPPAPIRARTGRGAILALLLALVPGTAPSQPTTRPAALPAFTIFGWVSPPVGYTTAERYAELAGVGMNVATNAWDDPHQRDENLRRLDLAARVGIRCFVHDDRFHRAWLLGLDTPAAAAVIDSIVADYRDHPGFLGYSFLDEPRATDFPALETLFVELRKRDPDHPAWNNLGGIRFYGDTTLWIDHTVGYLERVHPRVLCNDHYDFRNGFDYGEFVLNAATLRTWSLRYGIPFWSIIQLVPHANVRPITEGELAWQVSMLLAYGASGVGYFTYWTPAPDPALNWGPAIITYDGVRTPWYDVVGRENRLLKPAGETLVGLTWLSTQHAGSRPRGAEWFRGDDWLVAVEGRAAIGRFVDAAGVPYLVVVNSDSLAPRSVTLTLVGTSGVSRLGAARDDWRPVAAEAMGSDVRVPLHLGAGEFALLRLEGTFGAPGVAHLSPTLAVVPSPASGEVRFDLTRLAGDARVEVLDVTGRLVWTRRPAAGSASLVWRGERDPGGTAPAGLYITRVTDTRGTKSRLWSWLGTR